MLKRLWSYQFFNKNKNAKLFAEKLLWLIELIDMWNKKEFIPIHVILVSLFLLAEKKRIEQNPKPINCVDIYAVSCKCRQSWFIVVSENSYNRT